MNNLHFPDKETCKELSEIYFPITEYIYTDYWIFNREDKSFDAIQSNWDYVCPSYAEIIDELPVYIKAGENKYYLEITKKSVVYYDDDNSEILFEIYQPLNIALPKMVLVLNANNLLSFPPY